MRIKEKTTETVVFFPKNSINLSKNHSILLKSELTNKEYILSDLEDKDNLVDYYKFICDFANIPDGEYIYKIDEDACGLLILGDLKSIIEKVEYVEENNNKYIVYNDD